MNSRATAIDSRTGLSSEPGQVHDLFFLQASGFSRNSVLDRLSTHLRLSSLQLRIPLPGLKSAAVSLLFSENGRGPGSRVSRRSACAVEGLGMDKLLRHSQV